MLRVWRNFFLCMLVGNAAYAKLCSGPHKPWQVLFIQSYHVGQPMEDGFISGLRQALDSSGQWVDLHVEYMDGKRYPAPRIEKELDSLYQRKYASRCFDALVTADNMAFDYVRSRPALFGDLPLVFLGINNYHDSLVAGLPQATGIAEDVDLPGTLELIHTLQPHIRDLWLIADQTETGWRMRAEVEAMLKGDTLWRPHWLQNETYASLLDSLTQPAKPGAALLLTFSVDKAGTIHSEMEFLHKVGSSSRKALYTTLEHQVVEGVVGGSLLSNRQHGSMAGRMLLDILHGKPASDIPIHSISPKMLYVDYKALKHYGIDPSRVPKHVRMGNIPFSPWKSYYKEIIAIALVFLVLLGALGILLRMRAKLRASRERYRELVAHAHSVILRIDREGRIQFINEYGERLFGYTLEEMQGRTITETIVPEKDSSGQRLHGLIAQLLANPTAFLESENENIARDGRRLFMHWYNRPLFGSNGKLEAIFSIGADITEKHSREEAIDRFNRKVAHDLRSPLVTIRSFAEMLPEDLASGDQAAVLDDVKYIKHASTKMEQQVEELVHLFRMGEHEKEITRFSVAEVAEDARMLVAGRLQSRGVQVRITAQAWLTGERKRILDILQNLIDNAAKHMGDQPSPLIEVGSTMIEGKPALFVRDNGIGIEAIKLERIFEVFVKVDTSSDGPGLGLSLVRRMVETHGGRVWAESPGIGQGSTFWLRLDHLEL